MATNQFAQALHKGDRISTVVGLLTVEGVTVEGDRVHVRGSQNTTWNTRAFRTVTFVKSSKVRVYA